jgi:serine phosphatase RsbU (regulator of sigma subunit)
MSDGERMLSGLLDASHLAVLEDLPALVAEHAAAAGISRTMIYLSDLQGRFLAPLPGQYDEAGQPLGRMGVDATVAGRAYRNVEVVRIPAAEAAEHGTSRKMWVPLLDGTNRVGVLGLTTSADDEHAERHAVSLASLIGLLVVSKRESSDTYARLLRAERMTLSAEVLWNLMPPRTIANDEIVVSAVLEPAYEVGGDAYDYATDGASLHLSIFDAMGHDTEAGLTASVAIGCYRNTRRKGTDLLTVSETIDEAIAEQFSVQRFATGILATLDTRTGALTWINRGHHPPLVIRHGRQVATLETTPSPPMGLRLGATVGPASYQLEPGDRLLFYTDGIIEARSPDNELFGLERFIDFVIRREADGMPAPETLRRLIQTILDHQRGVLQDDATVVLVEWRAHRHDRLTV